MSVREAYRKKIRSKTKKVTVPSGMVFDIRRLNLFQLSSGSGCLPTLGVGKAPELYTQDEIDDLHRHFFEVLTSCVVSPRLVMKEDPTDPESIPLSEMDDEDLNFLYREIMAFSGLGGKHAEQASSFREGHGEVRPASQNGEGHGGEAEPDLGDRPGGVPGPLGLVRPHGMQPSVDLARGAVGEVAEG